jgi:hypothetical protein
MPSAFSTRSGRGVGEISLQTKRTAGRACALAAALLTLGLGCSSDPEPGSSGGGGSRAGTGGGAPPATAGTGGGGAPTAGSPAPMAGAAGRSDAGNRAPDRPRDSAVARPDAGRDTAAPTPPVRNDAGVIRDGGAASAPGNIAMGGRCNAPGGPGGCQAGLLCCQPCCEGRPAVCSSPVQNAAGVGVGQCPLPDLAINIEALETRIGSAPMTFAANSCEARETCVAQPGTRNTLHFEVQTPNIGTADLILGAPAGKPGFEFAACHEHYHFNNYALYQLLDGEGNEVLKGLKRAFCLMDTDRNPAYPLQSPANARYNCGRQGIQRGWADTYWNGLECQYIDVTDVPPGRYKLRVTINPNRFFPELSFDNNMAEVDVDIKPMVTSPVEACDGLVFGEQRECGWTRAMSGTCTPGRAMTASCGAECGGGTRTGDPMLRVCPGNEPCKFSGNNSNDDCSNQNNARGARVRFNCPASGQFTVLTAPSSTRQQSTCVVNVR